MRPPWTGHELQATFSLICHPLQSALSDIELWNNFTGGSQDAYSQLFRRFYPRLFQYGMKIVPDAGIVEDAIQELFLDVWQKPTAQPLQSVQAYLLQALKFKLYKTFRTKKRTRSNEEAEEHVFELSQETLQVEKEKDAERMGKMYSALEQLSPRQKEVVYLKIYKGLTYGEVSEVMQINYQVVRNLLCNALKVFRKLHPLLGLLYIILTGEQ